ncbi:hypothetical protein PR048_014286 [Dryococelus australis]|uniref:Uncharacterized protein n=1 Tax=Dryococelus australis TaxID=614101 RepID=A0ABQ9HE08_9NEOP|nr:hypothetical protein PR048_014286 [Dryococelus australis]
MSYSDQRTPKENPLHPKAVFIKGSIWEFPPNSAIFITLLVYFEAANRSAAEKRGCSKLLMKTVHFERETTAIGTRSKPLERWASSGRSARTSPRGGNRVRVPVARQPSPRSNIELREFPGLPPKLNPYALERTGSRVQIMGRDGFKIAKFLVYPEDQRADLAFALRGLKQRFESSALDSTPSPHKHSSVASRNLCTRLILTAALQPDDYLPMKLPTFQLRWEDCFAEGAEDTAEGHAKKARGKVSAPGLLVAGEDPRRAGRSPTRKHGDAREPPRSPPLVHRSSTPNKGKLVPMHSAAAALALLDNTEYVEFTEVKQSLTTVSSPHLTSLQATPLPRPFEIEFTGYLGLASAFTRKDWPGTTISNSITVTSSHEPVLAGEWEGNSSGNQGLLGTPFGQSTLEGVRSRVDNRTEAKFRVGHFGMGTPLLCATLLEQSSSLFDHSLHAAGYSLMPGRAAGTTFAKYAIAIAFQCFPRARHRIDIDINCLVSKRYEQAAIAQLFLLPAALPATTGKPAGNRNSFTRLRLVCRHSQFPSDSTQGDRYAQVCTSGEFGHSLGVLVRRSCRGQPPPELMQPDTRGARMWIFMASVAQRQQAAPFGKDALRDRRRGRRKCQEAATVLLPLVPFTEFRPQRGRPVVFCSSHPDANRLPLLADSVQKKHGFHFLCCFPAVRRARILPWEADQTIIYLQDVTRGFTRWCRGQITRLPLGSGEVASGFLQVEIVLDDCRWSAVFLSDLPFLSPLHSGAAPYSPHSALMYSHDALRADDGEARRVWSSTGMKGLAKPEIPDKTRRPSASANWESNAIAPSARVATGGAGIRQLRARSAARGCTCGLKRRGRPELYCGIPATLTPLLVKVLSCACAATVCGPLKSNLPFLKAVRDKRRATVAERLACSPPTKAIRAQTPAGSLRIFACGDRAGRCRWSADFLGDLPFPPPFHSGAADEQTSEARENTGLWSLDYRSLTLPDPITDLQGNE